MTDNRESRRTEGYDTNNIGQLVRKHNNITRTKILQLLKKQEYAKKISHIIDKHPKTVHYHLEHLLEDGLIQKTGRNKDRTKYRVFYQLTDLGKAVLDRINTVEVKKK